MKKPVFTLKKLKNLLLCKAKINIIHWHGIIENKKAFWKVIGGEAHLNYQLKKYQNS